MQGPSPGQGSGQLQAREARQARSFCWGKELEAGTLQDRDSQNVRPESKCVCSFMCACMCEPSGEGLLGILIHFHCARDPGRQLVPCLLAPTAEVGISVLVHYVSF